MDDLQITPAEAIRLHKFADIRPMWFVRTMMNAYSAHPVEGDDWNLTAFLIDVFNAGRVDGIRCERARRKARA